MYKTLKVSITTLFAGVATVVLLLAFNTALVSADDGQDHPKDKAQPAADQKEAEEEKKDDKKEDQKENNEGESYTYKAQPGDSYTEMARKAVQTYGVNNSVNLTPAGIIFAETNITNEANAGLLEIGQEVKISNEMVKKYVEQAGKLSEAEQKAWAAYVPGVDFNTNKVGEA